MTVIPELLVDEDVFYPSGDGEPMAETPIHVVAIMLLFQAIEDFFRGRTNFHLSANSFWYWKKGDNSARRAPDTMVVLGVEKKYRRSFFSWKEGGAVPNTVFEVCSEKNWRENLHERRQLYAQLGVKEYFLFDPEALHLQPSLQGFRLEDGVSVPLAYDSEDRLHSSELGLFLKAEGEMLRLVDAATGKPILTREEKIDEEKRRAEEQRQRAEHERQRAEEEHRQAEEERRQAQEERRRLEDERRRATALEAEVTRLQALLKQAQGGSNPANGTRPNN